MFWYLLQGAALASMVGQMTYGKRQFESHDVTIRQLIPIVHAAMNNLLLLVDADTAAFKQYMVSVRFEAFTAVTMMNDVFWDVTPCGSCKNRRFGGS
jgi:hypothetical protein